MVEYFYIKMNNDSMEFHTGMFDLKTEIECMELEYLYKYHGPVRMCDINRSISLVDFNNGYIV